MKVKGITLLSVEEYKKYRSNIKPINGWWWLRSPGFDSNLAACVGSDGFVYQYGCNVYRSRICVRPALAVKGAPSVESHFNFGGVSWTMISDDYAIADEPFCCMAFRKDWRADDANVYEASDIKTHLDSWLVGLYSTRKFKDIIRDLPNATDFELESLVRNLLLLERGAISDSTIRGFLEEEA